MKTMNEIQLSRIDLNLLVLFETVYTERHVASAAARLHVSPSAVSHGLRRLRQLFGDPLFLRTPKGVVPSARAEELNGPIADILGRVRGVMSSVTPFDAATSTRRFVLGLPDALAAVLLPPLIALLQREAPGIDLGIRHLLPQSGFDELETRASDLVVLPLDEDAPARFYSRALFDEEFVIAARRGHPFLKAPSLRSYCELCHVLVSVSGDSSGYIDQELAKKGISRRVALSVPHFMLALAALSDSDFVAAIPTTLMRAHAVRFKLASVKAPLPLRRWQVRIVAPAAAMPDGGLAWLFDAIERAAGSPRAARRR
ncbi:MAG TPA: LysR family transcriptional regulator [Polyangiaceae bacterium]|nr:LysR family transcriptional regulator [Polyangiaceae bacterium]